MGATSLADSIATAISSAKSVYRQYLRRAGLMALDRADIERLLVLVNDELEKSEVTGEIYLVGGAVMCLAFNARASTKDLDAYFEPTVRIANRESYPIDWLDDAVKGYLSHKVTTNPTWISPI
jgi:hypothetical protein